jgi:hypothetical protein
VKPSVTGTSPDLISILGSETRPNYEGASHPSGDSCARSAATATSSPAPARSSSSSTSFCATLARAGQPPSNTGRRRSTTSPSTLPSACRPTYKNQPPDLFTQKSSRSPHPVESIFQTRNLCYWSGENGIPHLFHSLHEIFETLESGIHRRRPFRDSFQLRHSRIRPIHATDPTLAHASHPGFSRCPRFRTRRGEWQIRGGHQQGLGELSASYRNGEGSRCDRHHGVRPGAAVETSENTLHHLGGAATISMQNLKAKT